MQEQKAQHQCLAIQLTAQQAPVQSQPVVVADAELECKQTQNQQAKVAMQGSQDQSRGHTQPEAQPASSAETHHEPGQSPWRMMQTQWKDEKA